MTDILTSGDENGLLGLAGEKYKQSAYLGAAGSFAQIVGSNINYQLMKTDLNQLNIQASNIELAAQQRANQLREQFISSIGSYQFGAAQRGVSVGSGSVRSNLESSATSLGLDLQRQQENAALKASALRTQYKIAKSRAKYMWEQDLVKGLSDIGGSVMTYKTGANIGG